ncbi:TetR/AcrR family transcriptional regulator [Alkalihalobacillus trypoxylicola]|uniref:TetR family transcriptional regulator n=1 Tax=Alkalihalobacillus trypoxylicola TaxID=519424 RepID=A0A161PG90_9BACI|nr:TetR/AcrR family transcriptional regulator [Alkalihalobacillus trypoxylicola]KYG31784.1 TetR family transcriptional regulator [Alkalihalobacillus trypoxylicola]
MPPKKKFSKEQIVDAAFEIARVEGLSKITIRKVADKLGSSIAPIYVNFNDVEELINDVVKKMITINQQMILEQNSGDTFRDIGIASLRFASEYSVLFNELMMKQNEYLKDYNQEIGNDLVSMMKESVTLEGFTDEELMNILLKMRIFQGGLSIMVANGLLPKDFTNDKVVELLDSTAEDVIVAARLRKNSK